MAEQKSEENIVFLPWTVDSMAQAVTVENPEKNKIYVDLAHSTDTTAMKSFEEGSNISIASFDYATGIAVFLTLCATGLAYWFGARSFILTKQSFDAVIMQIESSEISIAKSNKELIESQENLKKIDLMAERCNAIRMIAADFISLCEDLMYEAKSLQNNLIGELPIDYLKELTEKRNLMEIKGTNLELYLGRSHLSASVLMLKRGLIRDITPGLSRQNHVVDLEYWKDQIRKSKLELIDYFDEELLKVMNKGE